MAQKAASGQKEKPKQAWKSWQICATWDGWQRIDAKTTGGQPRAVEKIYITRQLLNKYLNFNLKFYFFPFCAPSSLSQPCYPGSVTGQQPHISTTVLKLVWGWHSALSVTAEHLHFILIYSDATLQTWAVLLLEKRDFLLATLLTVLSWAETFTLWEVVPVLCSFSERCSAEFVNTVLNIFPFFHCSRKILRPFPDWWLVH